MSKETSLMKPELPPCAHNVFWGKIGECTPCRLDRVTAERDAALAKLYTAEVALDFYATQEHFQGCHDWDTVSGEGENWLFPEDDKGGTCDDAIENGGVARHALKTINADASPLRSEPEGTSDMVAVTNIIRELLAWPQEKALAWYQTPNPNFGGASPEDLVKAGRSHKVYEFIRAAKDEQTTPKTEPSPSIAGDSSFPPSCNLHPLGPKPGCSNCKDVSPTRTKTGD